MPTKIRDLAKAAANRRSMHFVELVLVALQHEVPEDKELVAAIKTELTSRRPQGRPSKEA